MKYRIHRDGLIHEFTFDIKNQKSIVRNSFIDSISSLDSNDTISKKEVPCLDRKIIESYREKMVQSEASPVQNLDMSSSFDKTIIEIMKMYN